ncbi:MAG: thiol-activated cytolysin family protein [Bacteroidetes bacterium]|nr:thiol-activated cytolysin family protein [Bacteroidota bacterium]MCB0842296.1 thiol-activated cytolysin family protein [Bacteroidota bacterium]
MKKTNRKVFIFSILLTICLIHVSCKKDDVIKESVSQNWNALLENINDPLPPDSYSYEETLISEDTILQNGERWICQTREISATNNPSDFLVIGGAAGEYIWPFSLVQGNTITSPSPERIPVRRGAGELIIDNLTGTNVSSVLIDETTHSNVIEAANEIISNQSNNFPAKLNLNILKVRSQEELAWKLGLNAKFFRFFSAESNFEMSKDQNVNTFIVELKQSYYTLFTERPSKLEDFFHPEVTTKDLEPFIANDNPPAYVSSVTYGRIFYLLIESVEESASIEASLNASFAYGGFDGSGKHVSDLKSLKIQAFVYGGEKDAATEAIKAGPAQLDKFLTELNNGATITSGVPLSYTIRSVKTDKLLKNGIATEYELQNCELLPPNIDLYPLEIDFGSVCPWESFTKTLIITNSGGSETFYEFSLKNCFWELQAPTPCASSDFTGSFSLLPGESKIINITISTALGGLGAPNLCLSKLASTDCYYELTWDSGTKNGVINIPLKIEKILSSNDPSC